MLKSLNYGEVWQSNILTMPMELYSDSFHYREANAAIKDTKYFSRDPNLLLVGTLFNKLNNSNFNIWSYPF